MDSDEDPCEPITVDFPFDTGLKKAAVWRGMSVEAYVRLAVATMSEADANLADLARDSLVPGGKALGSRDELDAWFVAERERQNKS